MTPEEEFQQAMRKRQADVLRPRLKHNFPDIDTYNEDLVLFLAEQSRQPQIGRSDPQQVGYSQAVKRYVAAEARIAQLEAEIAALRERLATIRKLTAMDEETMR